MGKWWEKPGRVQWNEGRALEPGHWYVPLGNIIPPVRAMMAGMPDRVLVKDDTLREGEEQPNHKPITVAMKVKVARELEAAGLNDERAQKIVESKDNNLAQKMIRLIDSESATSQKPAREVKRFSVDKNGRLIPFKDLKASVCDPDKDFYLVQPKLESVVDYAERLVRFQEAFKPGPIMSAAEFEGKSKELIAEIRGNKNLANLLKGVHLPIILPKLDNFSDYGQTLEQIFLPVVKSAYEEQFPGQKFVNHRENDLAKKVSIIPESRHKELVAKMGKGIVVALYFPNPAQGFSVLATREQMAFLPECLMLAGGFDTATAQVEYPDILARDFHTPGYDLAALCWHSPVYSLFFRAHVGLLHFVPQGDLGRANDRYSSGLLFFGSAAA